MVERQAPAEGHPGKISYEWFARSIDPETKIPVGFVPLESVFSGGAVEFSYCSKLHDVGAGTGRSTEYLLSKVPVDRRKTLDLVVSEPSGENQPSILRRLGSIARLLQKDAQEAIRLERDCDVISIINAIHLFPEDLRVELLRESFNSLSADGSLIVSTTFIEEGIPDYEQPFFNKWMSNMFRMLVKFNEDARAVIRRVRESKLQMWPAEKYEEAFAQAGFRHFESFIQSMPCTLESLRGICHYPVFTSHILPGIDPKKAAVIASRTVKQTWEQFGRGDHDVSPRNTLVLVGRKV